MLKLTSGMGCRREMFLFMVLSLFSSYSRRDGCGTGFKRMGETTVIGMVMVIGFKKMGKARLVPPATCWESCGKLA